MRSSHACFFPLLAATCLLLAPGLAGTASAAEEEKTRSVLLAGEAEASDATGEEHASDPTDEEDSSPDSATEGADDQRADAEQEDVPDDIPDKPQLIGGPTAPTLAGDVEDLYVTATKREESIQDVAISMKALDAEFLKDSGLTEFGQLQEYVPNLSINPVTDRRGTVIRIRGIGSVGNNAGIDPSVGVFIDGVYQGRAGMSVGDMLDIERVEVLRGPQGTLYGKNTAAGLIHVISKRPSYDFETALEGVLGKYSNYEGRGSINIPLIDEKLATRLSGYRVVRDGFHHNTADELLAGLRSFDGDDVNDADKWGLKSRTVWEVTDSLSLLLTADYSYEDTKCCVADISTYNGFPTLLPNLSFQDLADTTGIRLIDADPFDWDVAIDAETTNEVEIGGISLTSEYELPFLAEWISGSTLTAIGAWRTYSSDSQFDGDFSYYNGILAFTNTDLDQYSLELRLASPGGDFFDYQTGLYFYHQNQDTLDRNGFEQDIIDTVGGFFGDEPFNNIGDNTHKTTSIAGFGQATLNFNEQWSLTGGLRYTWEKKERDGTQVSTSEIPIDAPPLLGPDIDVSQDRTAQNVSGTAILRFFPTEETMLYLSWASGFKSGGFNQLRTVSNVPGEFDDEESNNYEVGFRSTWYDGLLTLNGTFFYTEYDEFQAQTFDGSSISVRNAASLTSYGIEADLVLVPLPDLIIGSSIGWNVAEYDEFPNGTQTAQQRWDATGGFPIGCGELTLCVQDLGGERLDNAPEFSASSFLQYERLLPGLPMEAFFRTEYQYTSSRFLDQDLDPNLKQDPTHLVNLRAGIRAEDDLWELTAWVTNLTDEEWNVVGFDVPTLTGFAVVNAPPRQYGITLRLNF